VPAFLVRKVQGGELAVIYKSIRAKEHKGFDLLFIIVPEN
jgi:hypothetical protein